MAQDLNAEKPEDGVAMTPDGKIFYMPGAKRILAPEMLFNPAIL